MIPGLERPVSIEGPWKYCLCKQSEITALKKNPTLVKVQKKCSQLPSAYMNWELKKHVRAKVVALRQL